MLSPEGSGGSAGGARRGLLENDIVLGRFLDAHEQALTDEEVEALDRLLDLTDQRTAGPDPGARGARRRARQPAVRRCSRPRAA